MTARGQTVHTVHSSSAWQDQAHQPREREKETVGERSRVHIRSVDSVILGDQPDWLSSPARTPRSAGELKLRGAGRLCSLPRRSLAASRGRSPAVACLSSCCSLEGRQLQLLGTFHAFFVQHYLYYVHDSIADGLAISNALCWNILFTPS